MNRFTITLLTLTLVPTSAIGSDTFASQLRKAKHIGLSVDERLSAFTLRVYSTAQYNENVASFEEFRREREAFNERMAGYDRERKDLQKRGASADERNAITLKRNRENSNRPHSAFERSVKLHTVVSVGDDYLALSPLEEPSQRILIPFYRVGRVVVTASQAQSGTDRKTK